MSEAKNSLNWPLEAFHIAITLTSYTASFWVDWRIILAAILILQVQYVAFNGCVISIKQYGNTKESLHTRVLDMLGLNYDRVRVSRFVRYGIPIIILALAIWFQGIESHVVAIHL